MSRRTSGEGGNSGAYTRRAATSARGAARGSRTGTCAVAVLSFTERLAGVFHGQPDSFTGNLETADTAVSREMVAAVRHHQSQLGLPPFPKPIGGVYTVRAAPPQRMKFATDCRGCACVAADESAKQTWTTAFRSGLVAQLHAPPPLPPSRPPPTLAHRLRRAAASTEAAVVIAAAADDAPQSLPPRPLPPSMSADASDAAVTAAAARPSARRRRRRGRRRRVAPTHRRRRIAAAGPPPPPPRPPPTRSRHCRCCAPQKPPASIVVLLAARDARRAAAPH